MILATNNKGKIKEIKEILKDYEIKSLNEAGIDIDVVEDQDSFYGNALKKAKEIYEIAHEPVIADDSGLCITCLDDFPGVMTHRFLGDNASDIERNQRLIEMVNEKNSTRDARAICNLVYYDGEKIIVGEGVINGTITKEMRGTNGFGFDSILELPNKKTLAELTSDEKNKCSQRYLATIDLLNKLKDEL